MSSTLSQAAPALIPYDELLSRLGDPGLTILDVLPRHTYEEAHIPGALSMPLEEIPQRAAGVLPDKDREIVVYCGGPT